MSNKEEGFNIMLFIAALIFMVYGFFFLASMQKPISPELLDPTPIELLKPFDN